jgi:hypothetical protein
MDVLQAEKMTLPLKLFMGRPPLLTRSGDALPQQHSFKPVRLE